MVTSPFIVLTQEVPHPFLKFLLAKCVPVATGPPLPLVLWWGWWGVVGWQRANPVDEWGLPPAEPGGGAGEGVASVGVAAIGAVAGRGMRGRGGP